MSATGRGTERNERDYYPTPGWCTYRLLDRIGHLLPSHLDARWLEPCVGSAAIVDAVEAWWNDGTLSGFESRWTLVDLEPQTERIAITGNYLVTVLDAHVDVGITNPPYVIAQDFIESMLGDCDVVIALLRTGFLASEERVEFWKRHPADVYVLPNRPSFSDDGSTDATEYAWFVWGLTDGGHVEVLDVTPLEERRAHRLALTEGANPS